MKLVMKSSSNGKNDLIFFSKDEQDGAEEEVEVEDEAQEDAGIELEGRDREDRGSILPLLIHQSRLVEDYE